MAGENSVALGQATPDDVKTFLQEFCRTLPCDKEGRVKTIAYLPGQMDLYFSTCCTKPVATIAQGRITFKETLLLKADVVACFQKWRTRGHVQCEQTNQSAF